MIREHHWPDIPAVEILDTMFTHRGAVNPERRDLIDIGPGGMHLDFEAHAMTMLDTDRIRYWGSCFDDVRACSGSPLKAWPHDSGSAQAAGEAEGPWIAGFPHIHGWTPGGRCMITCLQAPEAGGELVLWDAGGLAFTFSPVVGTSVIFPMGSDDALAHGIRPVQGDVSRIMLVAVSIT